MSTIARRKIISKRIAELCAQAFTTNGVSEVFALEDLQRTIDKTTGIPKIGRADDSDNVLLFSNTLVGSIEDNELIRHIDTNILNNVDNQSLAEKFFIRADLFGIAIDATGMAPLLVGGVIVWQEDYLYNVWFLDETAANPPFGYDNTQSQGTYSIENLSAGGNNPYNISQFIDFNQIQTEIDLTQAKKVLDFDITELIPEYITQQDKINNFFTDYLTLRGELPNFEDLDSDSIIEELTEDGFVDDYQSRISSGNNLGYITRVDESVDSLNTDKTLEWLRNDLNKYLKDIDKIVVPEFDDARPEYENKSDGYIKLRALNQGIIIRKQEGTDVGISDYISTDVCDGPSFQCDGFTITMWVKFLDRVNTGTLFNYGNPLRAFDPRGFQLQTYVIYADDVMGGTHSFTGQTWRQYATSIGQENIFSDDYVRFVRLIVKDHSGHIRDSHLGYDWSTDHKRNNSISWTNVTYPQFGSNNEFLLINYTQIPINFEEWYYIVASFDPTVEEESYENGGVVVYDDTILPSLPLWWLGHLQAANTPNTIPSAYIADSGFGAKCKIEFISKSKLLRARGYKPE